MVVGNKKQMLPSILKSLRKREKLPQRKVSYALGIDTTYCKIENGKHPANKDQVGTLAELYQYDRNELVKVWLANKIFITALKVDVVASEALKLSD